MSRLEKDQARATLHFAVGTDMGPVAQLFAEFDLFARCELVIGTDPQGRPTATITSPYEIDSAENDEVIGRAMAAGCGTLASYAPPDCPACKRQYRQRNQLGDWRCLDCGHKYRKD